MMAVFLVLFQLGYSTYTLLLLARYALPLFTLLQVELKEPAKVDKTTAATLFGQVKTWATTTAALFLAYLTGTHTYVLPLVTIFTTILSNLPAFATLGAPLFAHLLKLYRFRFHFLRGWYVLSLSLCALCIVCSTFFPTYEALAYPLGLCSPLLIFVIYHLSEQERIDAVYYMGEALSRLHLDTFVRRLLEELWEQG